MIISIASCFYMIITSWIIWYEVTQRKRDEDWLYIFLLLNTIIFVALQIISYFLKGE